MNRQGFIDLDLASWQSVLDRNAPVFSKMQCGSRIGLMSEDDFEPPDATMLVWEATYAGEIRDLSWVRNGCNRPLVHRRRCDDPRYS